MTLPSSENDTSNHDIDSIIDDIAREREREREQHATRDEPRHVQ